MVGRPGAKALEAARKALEVVNALPNAPASAKDDIRARVEVIEKHSGN